MFLAFFVFHFISFVNGKLIFPSSSDFSITYYNHPFEKWI